MRVTWRKWDTSTWWKGMRGGCASTWSGVLSVTTGCWMTSGQNLTVKSTWARSTQANSCKQIPGFGSVVGFILHCLSSHCEGVRERKRSGQLTRLVHPAGYRLDQWPSNFLGSHPPFSVCMAAYSSDSKGWGMKKSCLYNYSCAIASPRCWRYCIIVLSWYCRIVL